MKGLNVKEVSPRLCRGENDPDSWNVLPHLQISYAVVSISYTCRKLLKSVLARIAFFQACFAAAIFNVLTAGDILTASLPRLRRPFDTVFLLPPGTGALRRNNAPAPSKIP